MEDEKFNRMKFEVKDNNLVIRECDSMLTNPEECDKCQQRFKCYTVRRKSTTNAKVVYYKQPLEEVLKWLDTINK